MLLSFEVANFRSIRTPIRLALRASRERRLGDRLLSGKDDEKILPVAAIFGDNGSGKSNLYRAVRYLQRLLLRPSATPAAKLPWDPFLLDDGDSAGHPTTFTVEFVRGERTYRLNLSVARAGISRETLEELRGERGVVLYSREAAPNSVDYSWQIEALQRRNPEHRDLIAFKTRDIWPNQLLLAGLRGKGVGEVDDVCKWLTDELTLMIPDSTLKLLEYGLPTTEGLLAFCNRLLPHSCLGVESLEPEEIAWNQLALPEDVKDELQQRLLDGQSTFVRGADGRRYTATARHGNIAAARLRTVHRTISGRLVRLDIDEESEGIQRFLDLLPAFYQLLKSEQPKVFFIDELDRSLHPLMARKIVTDFLATSAPQHRKQLIFTTHDTGLLDQAILRRDEIWIMQRNTAAESTLLSLADVKGVRYDKDIRKAYLNGEFGGVPQFTSAAIFANPGLDSSP